MRRSIFAAAMGFAILAAGGAQAQSAEAEALGVEVARTIFRAVSFDQVIAKELGSAKEAFAEVKSRPEWSGFLIQAMQEEVRHDLPTFERMFGRALAQDMSVDELRAGAQLLADPALQAAIRAAAQDGAEPTVRPSRDTERIAATRAGRSFLGKLEKIEDRLAPLQDEFAAELIPGAFRRFADKAEAGEAARKAAQPVVK